MSDLAVQWRVKVSTSDREDRKYNTCGAWEGFSIRGAYPVVYYYNIIAEVGTEFARQGGR